eukprot:4405308-Alexandrium_andersonii.AAC.1
MLHSLALELGCWASVKRWCFEVTSITTDMGTEKDLGSIPSSLLGQLDFLPHISRWGEDPSSCDLDA